MVSPQSVGHSNTTSSQPRKQLVKSNAKALSDYKPPKRLKLTPSAYERVSNREGLGLTKHDRKRVVVTKSKKLWWLFTTPFTTATEPIRITRCH